MQLEIIPHHTCLPNKPSGLSGAVTAQTVRKQIINRGERVQVFNHLVLVVLVSKGLLQKKPELLVGLCDKLGHWITGGCQNVILLVGGDCRSGGVEMRVIHQFHYFQSNVEEHLAIQRSSHWKNWLDKLSECGC